MTWPLVVGLGSHHGDDQAGWLVLDRLRELGYPPVQLQRALHPADILDVIDPLQRLVVCDACDGANPVGSVHCWRWPSDQLGTLHSRGTHDMEINDVLELAGKLQRCPSSVEFWAVEGLAWLPGSQPTDEVHAAAKHAASAIWREYADA